MKKIAIITGASSGFGREFVKKINLYYLIIEEIWVIARNERLLKSLKEEVNIPLKIYANDLRLDETFEIIEHDLKNDKPEVIVLVNNAGNGVVGDVLKLPEAELINMIRLNDEALVRLTRMTLPYMVKKSCIIQMASAGAFIPQAGNATYAASKAFVIAFSLALREELKPLGINVTVACPGPANTSFYDKASKYYNVPLYKKNNCESYQLIVKKILIDSKKGKAQSIYGMKMKGLKFISHIIPQMWLIRIARKKDQHEER